jgi:UDP-N-acetylglucosamine:LPS N-acetylglucosamine transferase
MPATDGRIERTRRQMDDTANRPGEGSSRKDRRSVLITLPGGGHLFQAEQLIKSIGDAADFSYIITDAESFKIDYGKMPRGTVFIVPRLATHGHNYLFRYIWSITKGFFVCCYAIIKSRADAVIGVASAVSIPLLLAGRVLNRKTVFIESITRVRNASRTCMYCSSLRLAEKIYVQWPDLEGRVPRAVYRGTVL